MKTINITSIKIKEIIFHPNDEDVLSVYYAVLDSENAEVFLKRKIISRADLPTATLTAIDGFTTKVQTKLEALEL